MAKLLETWLLIFSCVFVSFTPCTGFGNLIKKVLEQQRLLKQTQWQNSWDNFFWYECPANAAFYRMRSIHNNEKEDRLFRFDCRTVGTYYEDDCSYTGWVNSLDGVMNFHCPSGKVVTGVQSFHSNHHEDRQFKFKCCRPRKTCLSGCGTTGWLHSWDQYLDYSLPAGRVVRGFHSYHHNGAEDRRWRIHFCNYRRC